MQRKVRTEEQKQETAQLTSVVTGKTQENSPTGSQTMPIQKNNPNWDKVLNYLIGGLGLVVAVLIISLIVRVNSSAESSQPEEQTREITAEQTGNRSYEGAEQAKPKTIRVEVLNGSGVPKMAARCAEYLRSKGFDVVSTGNAPNSNYKNTIVQDRTGTIQNAQQIASVLGVSETGVILQKNPQLLLEVTVIVGQDYKSLKFINPR